MITIYKEDSLKRSRAYGYYKGAVKDRLKYFVETGNGFQGNTLLSSLDEDCAGIIWAEDNGVIVSCASYNLTKIGKKIFTVDFFQANNDDIYTQVNEYIEQFAGSLKCYFIEEMVTAKDDQRVNHLENIGYRKEFTLLFKKV